MKLFAHNFVEVKNTGRTTDKNSKTPVTDYRPTFTAVTRPTATRLSAYNVCRKRSDAALISSLSVSSSSVDYYISSHTLTNNVELVI